MRWIVGPIADVAISTRLSTPAGSLYLSTAGHRWLSDGKSPAQNAVGGFLAPLVLAAQRDGAGFAFLSEYGVQIAGDPLGAPTSLERLPLGSGLRSGAGGRRALVGITHAGDVLRSTDLGASWQKGAENAVGFANSVVMHERGQGLLFVLPQALWSTDDDGVTWRRVASSGKGVLSLELGQRDEITVLEGSQRVPLRSALAGQRLDPGAASGRVVVPLAPVAQAYGGRRVLTVAPLASGELGAAIYEPGEVPRYEPHPGLAGCKGQVSTAAFENTFYTACVDPYGRSEEPAELWRNDGAGWKRDGSLASGQHFIAGPRGMNLASPSLRPARRTDWVQLGDVQHALFHEDRLHVVLLADGHYVYEALRPDGSVDSEARLAPEDLVAPTLGVRDGHIWVFGLRGGEALELDMSGSGAAASAAWWPRGTRRVLLHEKNGIADAPSGCAALETRDGGRTWQTAGGRVPDGTCAETAADRCFERGCRIGPHARIGWGDAAAKPVESDAKAPPVRTAPAGVKLSCSMRAAADAEQDGTLFTEQNLVRSFAVGRGILWAASMWVGDGSVEVVLRRRGAAKLEKHVLLRANRASAGARYRVDTGPEGIAVARESSGQRGRFAAEIGALRWTERAAWLTRVPDSGAAPAGYPDVLSVGKDAVYFRGADVAGKVLGLRRGGKNEGFQLLTGTGQQQLVRLSTGPALLSAEGHQVAITTPSRIWHWVHWGDTRLGDWGGAPALGMDITSRHGVMDVSRSFVVPLGDSPDPAGVVELEPAALGAALSRPCEAGASTGVVVTVPFAARVTPDGGGKELDASALVRARPDQAACLEAWVADKTFLGTLIVIPAADLEQADQLMLEGDASNRALTVRGVECERR